MTARWSMLQGFQQHQQPPGAYQHPANGFAPPQQQQQQQQQTPPPAAVAAPKPDWTEHKAPDGRPYWYNAKTKVSKWEKPAELMNPEVTAATLICTVYYWNLAFDHTSSPAPSAEGRPNRGAPDSHVFHGPLPPPPPPPPPRACHTSALACSAAAAGRQVHLRWERSHAH